MKKLPAAVPHEEHLNHMLKDAEQAAAYLNVARAQGITNIAEALDMQRESVSRMLSKNGNPALTNFLKILDAAGLVIQVKTKEPIPA